MTMVPRVSIGMPVFNGAATIKHSIESLLRQTFSDFELIVSDNASTDSTRDIVEKLAKADPRIRYVRHAENRGANGNYSYLALVSRGEYFKWATSSDMCAPKFIEQCLFALERDPQAVLAAPRTSLFAGDILSAKPYDGDIEILDSTPSERLRKLRSSLGLNNVLNGLIRLDALRQTRLIEPYYQADIVLVGHLALLGKILLVNEHLYYRRMEVATATALQDRVAWRKHHYPTVSARMLFQSWKKCAGWLHAGISTPVPFSEKIRVLTLVARMCNWERRKLWDDLQSALQYFLRRGGRE